MSYSVQDVLRVMHIHAKKTTAIQAELERLVRQGKIYRLKDGKYRYAGSVKKTIGKLQMTDRGFGFVIPLERGVEDIFIPSMKMSDALHGDTVQVEEEFFNGRKEGRIVGIVERAIADIIGIYSGGNLAPLDDVFPQMPCTPGKEFAQSAEGKVVRARLTSYRPLRTKITAVLGNFDDPKIDDDIVIGKYRLQYEYPDPGEKFYETLRNELATELSKRKDLTKLLTFTIDPEDARDHDDSVSIEIVDEIIRVYVHIADVSFFIRAGEVLDAMAYERGMSVYLTDKFLPMLPLVITRDFCSLIEGNEKLTITAQMDFNSSGKCINEDIYESKVRVAKFLSYEEAFAIIDGSADAPHEWRTALTQLTECAKTIHGLRTKRGALDLDMPEFGVTLNDNKEPIEIHKRERTWAHRMIEEFMIAANETVARHLEKVLHTGIFRVHDRPSDEKMAAYQDLLEEFGITIQKLNVKKMQEIFHELEGNDAEAFLKKELVKSLKRAEYSEKNSGHFGLQSTSYTHFTSPIRRYPDLIVHRLLKQQMLDKKYLIQAARYLSEKEGDAERAEMLSYKIKALRYIKAQKVKPYTAVVVAEDIDKFRIELIDFGVRGIVYFKDCIPDQHTVMLGKTVLCRPLAIEPAYALLECEIMEVVNEKHI